MGFKAKIEAEAGHLLLGGVRSHTTVAFEEMRHAQKVAGIFYKENKAAGRRVKPSIQVYEVLAIDVYSDEVNDDA